MKAKVLLLSLCCLSMSLVSESYARQSYSHSYRSPKFGSSYGKTHSVRPYLRKDGTYIQRHRSGNPRSGVHCHNNICY